MSECAQSELPTCEGEEGDGEVKIGLVQRVLVQSCAEEQGARDDGIEAHLLRWEIWTTSHGELKRKFGCNFCMMPRSLQNPHIQGLVMLGYCMPWGDQLAHHKYIRCYDLRIAGTRANDATQRL